MPNHFIIGLSGGSASGKTLFLKRLMQRFGKEELCLISQDNYYKPQGQQPIDEQGVANYDTPEGIDLDAFLSDLKKLKAGQEVHLTEYTFNNPEKIPAKIVLKPAPIVLVEGIFVFYFEAIKAQLDLSIFIDTKEHIKLIRRLKRDYAERGYEMDDVLYRYEHHVSPNYERYIEPYKQDVDLIIPNNTHFENAFEVLEGFLTHKIKQL